MFRQESKQDRYFSEHFSAELFFFLSFFLLFFFFFLVHIENSSLAVAMRGSRHVTLAYAKSHLKVAKPHAVTSWK